METSKTESKQEAQWQTTPLANLVRNTASGNYYARVRLKGKLIWNSLKTDALAVAKLRLGDFLKEEGHRAEIVQSAARGKMTFGDAVGWVELALNRVRIWHLLATVQHLRISGDKHLPPKSN